MANSGEIIAASFTAGGGLGAIVFFLRYAKRTEDGTVANMAAEIAYFKGQLAACREENMALRSDLVAERIQSHSLRLRYGLLLAWVRRQNLTIPDELLESG
jgi:hypothetical protein